MPKCIHLYASGWRGYRYVFIMVTTCSCIEICVSRGIAARMSETQRLETLQPYYSAMLVHVFSMICFPPIRRYAKIVTLYGDVRSSACIRRVGSHAPSNAIFSGECANKYKIKFLIHFYYRTRESRWLLTRVCFCHRHTHTGFCVIVLFYHRVVIIITITSKYTHANSSGLDIIILSLWLRKPN